MRAYHHRRLRQGRTRSRRRGPSPATLILAVMPIVLIGFAVATAFIAAGATYVAGLQSEFTPPAEAIDARGGGARIYDRNGELLYEFLDEEYGRQQRVALGDISPLLRDATIASEDASFYTNPGVNIRGLARASIENFKPGDGFLQGSGGSSITQQLVKQIYFTPEERRERSVSRKVREAALALEITRDYSKDQILEWYLNEIPYGGVLTGIESAAQGYFGVSARDVTLGQAAFLAGLPQSPGEYDPFTNMPAAIGRQHEVLELMVKHGYLTPLEAAWARLEVITLSPKPQPFLAPHFVLYVGEYITQQLGEEALLHGGLEVTTTLDLALQTRANEILEQHLRTYENSTNGHNGSVVIIEPPTGQILAMVGSRDYFRDDIQGRVNNATALNSPGSTLKPFTYATAFMQGWSPEWPIVDTNITYRESDGETFSPRNPDGRTRGVVRLREALGNSYNIPAFKTILFTGVDNMLATSKAMGITTLDRDLGPATTLGGVDVKLIDMVYAYSTFANNGIMSGVPTTAALPDGNRNLDPVPVLEVKNRKGETVIDHRVSQTLSVIDPEYAYMVTDILSNDRDRSVTYGLGSNLNIPGHRVAVKTGTSEPFEKSKLIGDTWTIGYTPGIAVGVWVGNSDNTPMTNIFSTTIAGRTWHDTFRAALEGKEPRDWVRPDGLVEATVCVPSGRKPIEGERCPTVRGTFAAQAIARNDASWWGGEELSEPYRGNGVPPEITGWKRTLSEEYLRMYRAGGGSRTPARAPQQPAPAQPAPVAPPSAPAPPQQDGRGPDGQGPPGQQGRD